MFDFVTKKAETENTQLIIHDKGWREPCGMHRKV